MIEWSTFPLIEEIYKGNELSKTSTNKKFLLVQKEGNRNAKRNIERSRKRNFYQQVTDIYATSIDYNPKSNTIKKFFATVQNKLHYAEMQALEHRTMTMDDYVKELDNEILHNRRKIY